jgi:tRNA threonylcarbamoyladenosine biosynthesis protein TsaB
MELSRSRIIFFGSGAKKWEKMNSAPTALFEMQIDYIQPFAKYAHNDFDQANWADPVYSEPVYLKEFFSY